MLHGNPPDTTSLCPAVETARLLFMLQLVPLSFQPAMNLASRRRAFQLHPLLATLRLARIWRLRCSLNVPLNCLSVPQGSFAPRFFERATRFSERAPSFSERAPDLFERAPRLFDDGGGFLSFGIPLPQKTAERNYQLPINCPRGRWYL